MTPRSLALATAFHVVSIGSLGLFSASEVSFAGAADKRPFMSIASLERRAERSAVEEIHEPVWEADDERLHEELAEMDWVVEPLTDTFEGELSSDSEGSLTPVFDGQAMPSWLHPQKRRLEPETVEVDSSPPSPETIVQAEERQEALPQTVAPDVLPLLLEAHPPAYPAVARRKHWEGSTICRIRVGANGLVLAVEIETSSGFESLDSAAVDAVGKWRFTPGLKHGIAAEFDVSHKVTFRLEP